MKLMKIAAMAAAAALLMAVLGGCGRVAAEIKEELREDSLSAEIAEEFRENGVAQERGGEPRGAGTSAPERLTMEQAKELALEKLGVTDATFIERECKFDEGVYELELVSGDFKYEVDVDAYSGQVWEVDRDHRIDWD